MLYQERVLSCPDALSVTTNAQIQKNTISEFNCKTLIRPSRYIGSRHTVNVKRANRHCLDSIVQMANNQRSIGFKP